MAFSALFLAALLAFPTSILAEPKVLGLDFDKREVFAQDQPLRKRASDSATVYNAQGSLLYLVNVTVGTPGQKLMCYALDTLDGRPARGVTAEEFLRKKGRCGMSWVGIASWELV